MRKIILTIAAIMLAFPMNAKVDWTAGWTSGNYASNKWPPNAESGWVNCGTEGCRVCEILKLEKVADLNNNAPSPPETSCGLNRICTFQLGDGSKFTIKTEQYCHATTECRGSGKKETCGHQIYSGYFRVYLTINGINNDPYPITYYDTGRANGSCSSTSDLNTLKSHIMKTATNLAKEIVCELEPDGNGTLSKDAIVIARPTSCANSGTLFPDVYRYYEVTKCNNIDTKPGATTNIKNPYPPNSGTFTQYCGIDE